ncbi:MAG: RcpC/CpaB family pilus assembly protein [Actinomycetota bacterium]|nr:RcpC/CpaB family pilus assembly protein [Actinomycetota bacterium]
MSRRLLGVVGAVLLALVGTVLLVNYVNDEDDPAEDVAAPDEPGLVQVYVARDDIPAGASGENLSRLITTENRTTEEAAANRIVDLAAIDEKTAVANLPAGTVLLTTHFVEEGSPYLPRTPLTDIPANLLQTSFSLEPQRVIGGQLRPGDRVAVVASYNEAGHPTANAAQRTDLLSVSSLVLQKALVTNVQVEQLPNDDTNSDDPNVPSVTPSGQLNVTLGLLPEELPRLVNALEFGRVWLALESEDNYELPPAIDGRSTGRSPSAVPAGTPVTPADPVTAQ